MQIEQKFSKVVDHVKDNRGSYAWIAGSAFGATVATVLIAKMFDGKHLVDLSDELRRIQARRKNMSYNETPIEGCAIMDRNEKIVIAATAVIAAGSAALFAVKRIKAARAEKQIIAEAAEMAETVADNKPANA